MGEDLSGTGTDPGRMSRPGVPAPADERVWPAAASSWA